MEYDLINTNISLLRLTEDLKSDANEIYMESILNNVTRKIPKSLIDFLGMIMDRLSMLSITNVLYNIYINKYLNYQRSLTQDARKKLWRRKSKALGPQSTFWRLMEECDNFDVELNGISSLPKALED